MDLRKKFLEFFKERGHIEFPSAPLVPNDPTLLYNSAGMVQFKEYFSGIKRDIKRATSCQMCLRTTDIDSVGRTFRHMTFFEMLGNFSFGDYFKHEAIDYAVEFLRDLNIDFGRIYASVYIDDDVSYEYWKKILRNKVIRLGEESNFWKMGDTGPAGPCSEIIYDLGEEYTCGSRCYIGVCDCDRWLELWNLVFTEFYKEPSGLKPLPQKNIDTGMGLERLLWILEGKKTPFETSIFKNINSYLSNYELTQSEKTIIIDHLRAAVFITSEAVWPSNSSRGYVLRRILRRVFKTLLNKDIDISKCINLIVDDFSDAYPHIKKGMNFTVYIIENEFQQFKNVVEVGIKKINEMNSIDYEDIFTLHDTYGVPVEISCEILNERGFKIDEEEALKYVKEKISSRKSKFVSVANEKISIDVSKLPLKKSTFVGYETLHALADTVATFALDGSEKELHENSIGYTIIEPTPFYAESGGQVGDRGILKNENLLVEVIDTKYLDSLIISKVKVIKGLLKQGLTLHAEVDRNFRINTARNHTATHLLHAALRKIFGESVKQAGSYVGPDKLRFDFTYSKELTPEKINEVEKEVNSAINSGIKRQRKKMKYSDAINSGALAFFLDTYPQEVYVVKYGDFSYEVCGGTHLETTLEAIRFKIIKWGSIGSGIKRIEALTGDGLMKYYEERIKELNDILNELNCTTAMDAIKKIKSLKEKKETSALKLNEHNFEKNGLKIKIVEFLDANHKQMLSESDKWEKNEKGLWIGISGKIIAIKSNVDVNALNILKKINSALGGSGGGNEKTATGKIESYSPEGILKAIEN